VDDKRDYLFASWCGWFRAMPTRAEYSPKVKLLTAWRLECANQRAKIEEAETEAQTKGPPRILYPSLVRTNSAGSNSSYRSSESNDSAPASGALLHKDARAIIVGPDTPRDTPFPWTIDSPCAWPSKSSPREYSAATTNLSLSEACASSHVSESTAPTLEDKKAIFLKRKHIPVPKVAHEQEQKSFLSVPIQETTLDTTPQHSNITSVLPDTRGTHRRTTSIQLPQTRLGDIYISEFGTRKEAEQISPTKRLPSSLSVATIPSKSIHEEASNNTSDGMDLSEVLVQYSPFFQWATTSTIPVSGSSNETIANTLNGTHPIAEPLLSAPLSCEKKKPPHKIPVWSGSLLATNKKKLPAAVSEVEPKSPASLPPPPKVLPCPDRVPCVVPEPRFDDQRVLLPGDSSERHRTCEDTPVNVTEHTCEHAHAHTNIAHPDDKMQDQEYAVGLTDNVHVQPVQKANAQEECVQIENVRATENIQTEDVQNTIDVMCTENEDVQKLVSVSKSKFEQHEEAYQQDETKSCASVEIVRHVEEAKEEQNNEQSRKFQDVRDTNVQEQPMQQTGTRMSLVSVPCVDQDEKYTSEVYDTDVNMPAACIVDDVDKSTAMQLDVPNATAKSPADVDATVSYSEKSDNLDQKQYSDGSAIDKTNDTEGIAVLSASNSYYHISPMRKKDHVHMNVLELTPITLTLPKPAGGKNRCLKRTETLD